LPQLPSMQESRRHALSPSMNIAVASSLAEKATVVGLEDALAVGEVKADAKNPRREILGKAATLALSAALTGASAAYAEGENSAAPEAPAPAPPPPAPPPPAPTLATGMTKKSGISYTVLSNGGGKTPKPVAGDLVAIRFKGTVKGSKVSFDDILANPEPYYMRLGNGVTLPAVEEALLEMRTGDKWQLDVPGKLGFGEKGRSSSPGKPRIPANAELEFILELVAVPGKDEELIETAGDAQ